MDRLALTVVVALTDPAIPFAITVNLVSGHLLGAG